MVIGRSNEGAAIYVDFIGSCPERKAAMDRELHEALKALAEIQKRQRLHTILLTSDLISGDVVAQVMGPHEHKTRVYRPLDGIPDGLASVLDA